jgi:molybdopterin-synthase adenylyltransferase
MILRRATAPDEQGKARVESGKVDVNRYQRQVLLPQIGQAGQARLATSRVLIAGCGALGSVVADQLARAGVGLLRIVDRDVVEWTNLQRQTLFEESDARDGVPKAVAAKRRLQLVNSTIDVEAIVPDVHGGNLEQIAGLVGDADGRIHLILDGTDNVETRYLLNDVAIKHGVPWVYGACVGTEGRVMAVRPGTTPCLRCVFPTPPAGAELPTCDTAGVLAPAANVVASLQAVAALRLLVAEQQVAGQLLSLDAWRGRFHTTDLPERRPDCPACGLRRFEFLERTPADTVTLSGRRTVLVRPADRMSRTDLSAAAQRLQGICGSVQRTPYLLRCRLNEPAGVELTVFEDGRLIVSGMTDLDRAKGLYARYVGA